MALFLFALSCDLAHLSRFRLGWLDRAATLAFGLAAVLSLATALSGKLSADALENSLAEPARAAVGLHADWAFATVVLFFVTFAVRFEAFWRDRALETPRTTRPRFAALALALLGAFALLQTASRGGELVLRYGVGVERAQ